MNKRRTIIGAIAAAVVGVPAIAATTTSAQAERSPEAAATAQSADASASDTTKRRKWPHRMTTSEPTDPLGGRVQFRGKRDVVRLCDIDADDHYVSFKAGANYPLTTTKGKGKGDCTWRSRGRGGRFNLRESGKLRFVICLRNADDEVYRDSCNVARWSAKPRP